MVLHLQFPDYLESQWQLDYCCSLRVVFRHLDGFCEVSGIGSTIDKIKERDWQRAGGSVFPYVIGVYGPFLHIR